MGLLFEPSDPLYFRSRYSSPQVILERPKPRETCEMLLVCGRRDSKRDISYTPFSRRKSLAKGLLEGSNQPKKPDSESTFRQMTKASTFAQEGVAFLTNQKGLSFGSRRVSPFQNLCSKLRCRNDATSGETLSFHGFRWPMLVFTRLLQLFMSAKNMKCPLKQQNSPSSHFM